MADTGQHEWTKSNEVRQHSEKERASPLPSRFPAEQHAAPQPVCHYIHFGSIAFVFRVRSMTKVFVDIDEIIRQYSGHGFKTSSSDQVGTHDSSRSVGKGPGLGSRDSGATQREQGDRLYDGAEDASNHDRKGARRSRR